MSDVIANEFYPIKIDALPGSWASSSVGSAIHDVQSGFPCGAHHREAEGVPHLRPMNISREGDLDLSDLKYVSPDVSPLRIENGDVLFNNTNSPELIGKTTIIPESAPQELAFSNHMTRLKPPKGINSKFAAYQLHFLWMSGYFRHRCTHHVNQASLSSSALADSVPFVFAPTNEQDRIVDEIEKQFTRLDAATAALKRVHANLMRYRASVLKAACEGRLVPTEAALARKEGRDYEPAGKLLQRILRERRARWEADTLAKMQASGKPPKDDHWKQKYREPSVPDTTNLPPLSEGWCWAGLEQIAAFQNGRPFPSAQYRLDGIKLLRPGNLHLSGKVVWDDKNTRCLPNVFAEENQDLIIRGNELIMNLTAQSLKDEFLGRICITDQDDLSLLNQRLARITPVVVPPMFLLWTLRSWRFRRFVDRLNTGSLIQHMFTSQLADFAVALPPLTEQQGISETVDAQLSVLNAQEEMLKRTDSRSGGLRMAILEAAFTGQLVPQDPTDEPAPALLERIRAERSASDPHRPARRTRKEAVHA
jgi:type I restriction enzyme S subunit